MNGQHVTVEGEWHLQSMQSLDTEWDSQRSWPPVSCWTCTSHKLCCSSPSAST